MGELDNMFKSIGNQYSEAGKSILSDYQDAGKSVVNQYTGLILGTNRKTKVSKDSKEDPNKIKPKHYIARFTFSLYKLLHRKIKAYGIPVMTILFYTAITALTKQFIPTVNPVHSCIVATILYITGFWWAAKNTRNYYTILFEKYGLSKTYKKMIYYGKDKNKEGNIIWKFKSTMTLSDLKAGIEKIELVLKSNVIDIKQNKNKRFYNIVTSKYPIKEVNYKRVVEEAPVLCKKIHAAFKQLGVNITNLHEVDKENLYTLHFDCMETKKTVSGLMSEIIHMTKTKNLELETGTIRDFEIKLSKKIKTSTFGDMLVNTNLTPDNNLIVGISEANKLITLNIKTMVHSIIAGTSGMGKSNLAHVIITSLLACNGDFSFFLFDPKGSELKRYFDINRVFYSGNKEIIIKALRELVTEMVRRNKIIEQHKFINNIETYNQQFPNNKMHYIVVYIEEISNLMESSNQEQQKEFVSLVTRLTQLGRSTGFRLFLSTQYPKKEVLPTIIKNSCPERFGFGCQSDYESKVVIEAPDLKDIKTKGTILLKTEKVQDMIKIQVPYLNDHEIEPVVTYLEKRHNKKGKYPIGERYVSHVSDRINSEVGTVSPTKYAVPYDTPYDTSYDTKNSMIQDKEIIIQNEDDLLKFYTNLNTKEILSVRKTAEHVNIGVTKLQTYRKILFDRGDLIYDPDTRKTRLNTKVKLKIIK